MGLDKGRMIFRKIPKSSSRPPCRLFQFFGNALEIIFMIIILKALIAPGSQQGPVGIGQLQAAYHQIAGNHTPGKKHGNDNHIDEKLRPPPDKTGKGDRPGLW